MQVPPNLYKYTTQSTAKIVLETGRLRWSSPELFNDPSEFQRIPRFDPPLKEALNTLTQVLVEAALGRGEIDEARLSGLSRHMFLLFKFGFANGIQPEDFLKNDERETRELDQMYQELIRSYFGTAFIRQARVMCLTANNMNPAMWANYAGNHTGCVLGFRHIPEKSTAFTKARPVTYSSEPPVLCSGLDFCLYFDKLGIGQRVMDLVCFTKRSEWQYEQEWRVVTWRSDEGNALFGDYIFLPQELESITFGLRTPKEEKDILRSIVSDHFPDCTIYQIKIKNGEIYRSPE
jgi:hypothetical protein